MPFGVERALAEALASATYGDLSAQAVTDTLRSALDWLGSALAGSLEPPASMTRRVVAALGTSEEATVFGGGRSSAAGAALANGVASHTLELDDIHKGSTVHAAAPIIPAALAVAEREHSDGRAFLLAVAVGYEAALRIGEAVNPSHYRFWHPTGTVATFGAAVAAGSLMHLTPAQMLDALGTAGTQAAGLWEFNADGAMSKHLHPGKAAFNGILAADLARAGFTGASRILEGERGFFRAMSESADATRITDGLAARGRSPDDRSLTFAAPQVPGGAEPRPSGSEFRPALQDNRWKISENCFKIHGCCGHTHSAVDLALDLRAEVVAPIADIRIETYGPGYEIVKNQSPQTAYQAKFSIAWCVASALLVGEVAWPVDSIGLLLDRTRVTVAPDLTAKYPSAWPARLRITLQDGTVLSGAADYPRGNPENPVSTEALEEKFLRLVAPRFSDDVAQRALETVSSLERCADMAGAFRNLL